MPDARSLSDRLVKALLAIRFGVGPHERLAHETVTRCLVPAVLAELLPEPNRTFTGPGDTGEDVTVPVWDDLFLGEITPWSEGLTIGEDYIEDVTPDQVERAGLVLLAASVEMRRHDAWKENGDGDQ